MKSKKNRKGGAANKKDTSKPIFDMKETMFEELKLPVVEELKEEKGA